MIQMIKNYFKGTGFLSENTLKNEAQKDFKHGIVLDSSVTTPIERKIIAYYQNQLQSLHSENFGKLIELLKTQNNDNAIASFILLHSKEENYLISEGILKLEFYRKEFYNHSYETLKGEKNSQTMHMDNFYLDSENIFIRKFNIPVDKVNDIYTYLAWNEANKMNLKLQENYNINLEHTISEFAESIFYKIQCDIDAYAKTCNIRSIFEKFENGEISKASLDDQLTKLSLDEEKILQKFNLALELYKSIITKTQNDNILFDSSRFKFNLYFKLPSIIESNDELSVYMKVKEDFNSLDNISTISFRINQFEMFLKDKYQNLLAIYNSEHIKQYKYLEDYEVLSATLSKTEVNSIAHRNYNPYIIESAINYENQIEIKFDKLLNFFRDEIIKIFNDSTLANDVEKNFPVKPRLRFYFKMFSTEQLDVAAIKNAAFEDSLVYKYIIKTATPFMILVANRFQILIEENYKQYAISSQEEKVSESMKEFDYESLLADFIEKENKIRDEYKEFELIYIREFLSQQVLKGIEETNINNLENYIPELKLYFEHFAENKKTITSEDVIKFSTNDSLIKSAETAYPDYTGSEKIIRDIYQQKIVALFRFKKYSEMTEDDKQSLNMHQTNIASEYTQAIEIYRKNYITDDNKIFSLGMPILNLISDYGSFYNSKFSSISSSKVAEFAMIDAINKSESAIYVYSIKSTFAPYIKSGIAETEELSKIAIKLIGVFTNLYLETYIRVRTAIDEHFNKEIFEEKVKNIIYPFDEVFAFEVLDELEEMSKAKKGKLDIPSPIMMSIHKEYQVKMNNFSKEAFKIIEDAKLAYINDGNKHELIAKLEEVYYEIKNINIEYEVTITSYLEKLDMLSEKSKILGLDAENLIKIIRQYLPKSYDIQNNNLYVNHDLNNFQTVDEEV